MMLDAGAETDAVNSVGRTAAQMAAFVGMPKHMELWWNNIFNVIVQISTLLFEKLKSVKYIY